MKNFKVKEKLEISDLENLFKKGEKPCGCLLTGLEYERLPVNIQTAKNVDYYDYNGVLNLLNKFAHCEHWDYITDSTNGNVLGLTNGEDTITLEPGCQLELSIKPEFFIKDLEKKITDLDNLLTKHLDYNGIKLLNYGISPLCTYHNINILPKNRYKLMAKYMWGILSDVMMRETAGIQVAIDYKSEEDMAEKFEIVNLLSPFMTAIFANSPIRGGADTGYKSFRALSWLYTDDERCGFATNFKKDFSYKNYIDRILDVPMIFILRENKNIPINGKITFRQFMNSGFEGFEAELSDFELHSNLYFPEVRLRSFIEIRNHDCVNKNLMFAIPAIYKGILYNPLAIQDIKYLLRKITFEKLEELRYSVAKTALQTEIDNHIVGDYAKEILNIAEKSLKQNGDGEEKYLDGIKELTFQNLSPADLVLKNWYTICDKNPLNLTKTL